MNTEIKNKILNIFFKQKDLWQANLTKLDNAVKSVIFHINKHRLSVVDVKEKNDGFENGLILINDKNDRIFLKIVDIKYLYVRFSEVYTSNLLSELTSVIFLISHNANYGFVIISSFQIAKNFEKLTLMINKYNIDNLLKRQNILNSILKIFVKSLIFNYFDLKPENIVVDLATDNAYLVDFSANEFWKRKTGSDFCSLFKFNIDNITESTIFKPIKVGEYVLFEYIKSSKLLIDVLCLGQSQHGWIENLGSYGCPFFKNNVCSVSMYDVFIKILELYNENFIKNKVIKLFKISFKNLYKERINIVKNGGNKLKLRYINEGISRIKKLYSISCDLKIIRYQKNIL